MALPLLLCTTGGYVPVIFIYVAQLRRDFIDLTICLYCPCWMNKKNMSRHTKGAGSRLQLYIFKGRNAVYGCKITMRNDSGATAGKEYSTSCSHVIYCLFHIRKVRSRLLKDHPGIFQRVFSSI